MFLFICTYFYLFDRMIVGFTTPCAISNLFTFFYIDGDIKDILKIKTHPY
jgi:hypothetical protein